MYECYPWNRRPRARAQTVSSCFCRQAQPMNVHDGARLESRTRRSCNDSVTPLTASLNASLNACSACLPALCSAHEATLLVLFTPRALCRDLSFSPIDPQNLFVSATFRGQCLWRSGQLWRTAWAKLPAPTLPHPLTKSLLSILHPVSSVFDTVGVTNECPLSLGSRVPYSFHSQSSSTSMNVQTFGYLVYGLRSMICGKCVYIS